MRHAKSDWYSGAGSDFSRPLNERGLRDARAMGAWYAQTGRMPVCIACSTAVRARETLRLFAAGAGWDTAAVTHFHDELYHAGRDALVGVLAAYAAAAEVMLIGHNPGLESLLCWLAPADLNAQPFSKLVPTAAFFRLHLDVPLDGLAGGCARLDLSQRPKTL